MGKRQCTYIVKTFDYTFHTYLRIVMLFMYIRSTTRGSNVQNSSKKSHNSLKLTH